jgi:hypothetical protein
MPISGWDPIYPVMAEIQKIDPKNAVLDVGIGTGQWGFLVRNYHDMRYGRFDKASWKLRLLGIEGCSRYHNPAWQFYDDVRIGEASLAIEDFVKLGYGMVGNQFDVSIMIEVLEHFEKEKGKEVLRNLAKISKNLIFSYANMEQGAAHGNEYEVHRSTWSDAEIREIFPQAVQIYETGVGKFYHVAT